MADQQKVYIVQRNIRPHIRGIDGPGCSDLLPALSSLRREIEASALSSSLGPTFRAGRSPPDRPAHFISGCPRRASCYPAAMRHLLAMIAFGAAAAAASPAFCQNMTPRPPPEVGPRVAASECECRANGRVFVQGQQTCINGRLAVCAMDQNVTTWMTTLQACPQS
jgi:hypothetical protein